MIRIKRVTDRTLLHKSSNVKCLEISFIVQKEGNRGQERCLSLKVIGALMLVLPQENKFSLGI
jgi:hypothetical protein